MAFGGQAAAFAAEGAQRPWSLTEDAVNQWLDKARPGDTLVYARGGARPQPGAGVKAVQKAFDEGRVTFKQLRHGDFDYSFIAERKADPSRPPAQSRINQRRISEDDDEIAMLMAVLRRRANRGLPMGTNRELGEDIGGVGPARVAYLLRKQIGAERITVEAVGIGVRVCTILATGKRTAGAV